MSAAAGTPITAASPGDETWDRVMRRLRRLARHERALLAMALGTWGPDLTRDQRDRYRHRFGLRYVELLREQEKDLGHMPGLDDIDEVSDLVLPHHRRKIALALNDRTDGGVTLPDALRMTELVCDTIVRVALPGE